ncbi:SH3 domain-containing protein [Lentibacillus cibarius]|uniref:SH3 domain-containing protein n=1 Tax=Lentibacillus cibarius TaxID=2583219 RepID=A0A549YFH9_9BACI|nr:S-layer homology domain-containing protein [Lentibacillus cibarius]TRM10636.1 SH3 domain-containing protein [Lentibacillus cibarius]
MKNKRLWRTLLVGIASLGMLLMLPTLSFANKSFPDVDKSDAHYDAIMKLAEKEIVSGYADGSFGINRELKRRHGAILFYQALGLSKIADIKERLSRYKDVDENDQYAVQIAAVTPDIFAGSGGLFLPNDEMTREQMATTLVGAFGLEDNGTNPGIHLDNVGQSHRENVKILAQHDITNQFDDFRPKEAVKRGQFATFLYQSMITSDMVQEVPEEDADEDKPDEKPSEDKPDGEAVPDKDPDESKPNEDKPSDDNSNVDKPGEDKPSVDKPNKDNPDKEEPNEQPEPPEEKPDPEPEPPRPDKPAENKYTTVSYDISFNEAMERQRLPKVDGAGRFLASKELMSYYANPNNIQKDSPEFFQFLKLSYIPGVKASQINRRILADKGSLKGTADAFIEAGKKNDINVIYLIAHALHETGNGQSALSNGLKVGIDSNGRATYVTSENKDKLTKIKKTYNMFGIGAYDSCPKKCGATRAYRQGWFTPEAAVKGGAVFIDNGYIGRGQDTLYKMRWNPVSPGDHQYATHLEWASIQARKIQEMYDLAGLLDSYSLRFDIPKYADQPGVSKKPTGERRFAIDKSSQGEVYSTSSRLNLRSYPWGEVKKTLSEGTEVEVIGENGGWFKVKAKSARKTGWVSSDYLTKPNPLRVVDITSSLNVRPEPNKKHSPIGKLENGDLVSGAVDSDENHIMKNDYYKIIYKGKEAWAHKDFLKEE